MISETMRSFGKVRFSGTGQVSSWGAMPTEVPFVRIALSASSFFKRSASEKSQILILQSVISVSSSTVCTRACVEAAGGSHEDGDLF